MMWGENGQVNGNGQSMYMSDASQPADQPVVEADRVVGLALIEHHFTPQFYLDLEGSVGQLKWSNQGGGCNTLWLRLRRGPVRQGALSPSATTWLVAPTSAGTRSPTSTSTSS